MAAFLLQIQHATPYLSAVETLANVAFNRVPMLATAPIITIESPPAIKAYSIDVAADSSARKAWNFLFMMEVSSISPKASVNCHLLIRILFSLTSRIGPKAEVTSHLFDVRFTPESGHWAAAFECPLWAISNIARLVKNGFYRQLKRPQISKRTTGNCGGPSIMDESRCNMHSVRQHIN
jgi:hypothetical protein